MAEKKAPKKTNRKRPAGSGRAPFDKPHTLLRVYVPSYIVEQMRTEGEVSSRVREVLEHAYPLAKE